MGENINLVLPEMEKFKGIQITGARTNAFSPTYEKFNLCESDLCEFHC